MQGDALTRVLLALILVCLLVLVGQGVGVLPMAAASGPAGATPRYQVTVQAMRGGPLLLRVDTVTGRVWRKPLSGDGPWVPVVREEADDAADAPEPPPAASSAAPGDALPEPSLAEADPEEVAALADLAEREIRGEVEPADAATQAKLRELRGAGTLVKVLEDARSPALRQWAVQQIVGLGPEASIPIFAHLLDREDPAIVQIAIAQLRAAGDPRAIPRLEALSEHPDPRVRKAARQAAESLR